MSGGEGEIGSKRGEKTELQSDKTGRKGIKG